MNLHLLFGVRYRNIDCSHCSVKRLASNTPRRAPSDVRYEEFLWAMGDIGQMKTEVHYIKQYSLQFQIDYSRANVMHQVEPLGPGAYFQVSLIVQQLSCT